MLDLGSARKRATFRHRALVVSGGPERRGELLALQFG